MKIFIKNFKNNLRRFFYGKILRKTYLRNGSCKGCGRCCQKIYVRHSRDVIKTEEEFEKLKTLHFFYGYLKVLDKDSIGLIFECTKLNKETGKCTAYKTRPVLCRQYPQEEIFMMGGSITENCGFNFDPIQKFEDVFKKVISKQKNK